MPEKRRFEVSDICIHALDGVRGGPLQVLICRDHTRKGVCSPDIGDLSDGGIPVIVIFDPNTGEPLISNVMEPVVITVRHLRD